jgi:hypothetical protein
MERSFSKLAPVPMRQDDIFRRIEQLADSHVDALDKAQVQAEAKEGSPSAEDDGLPPTYDVPPFLEPPPSVVQLIFLERDSPLGAPTLNLDLTVLNEKDQRRALRHFEKCSYTAAGSPSLIPGAVQRRMHERDPELSAKRKRDLLEEAERRYQQVKTRLSKIIHHNKAKADPTPLEAQPSFSRGNDGMGGNPSEDKKSSIAINRAPSSSSSGPPPLMVPAKASLLSRKLRPQPAASPSTEPSGSPPRTLPPLHRGDTSASASNSNSVIERTSESKSEKGETHTPLIDSDGSVDEGSVVSSADWLAQKQRELKKLREGIGTSLGWGLSRTSATPVKKKGEMDSISTDSNGTSSSHSDNKAKESFLPAVESPLRRNRVNPHRLPATGGSMGGRLGLGLDQLVLLAEEPKVFGRGSGGSSKPGAGDHGQRQREADSYPAWSSPTALRQAKLPSLAESGATVGRDRSTPSPGPSASPSRTSTSTFPSSSSSNSAYVQGVTQWEASQRAELETECLEIMSLLFASAKYKLNLCR